MKRIMWVLLAVVVLGGCAAHPKLVWAKTDYAEEEFKRDNYQCTQESRTQWYGQGAVGIAVASANAEKSSRNLYQMCMEGHGYRLMTEEELSTKANTGINCDIKPGPAVVTKVVHGSPAHNAGVRLGDIIIERDGKQVNSVLDMQKLPKLEAGKPVAYKLRRGDEIFEVLLIPIPATELIR
ncbi:MAG TPA: PDZ domain-containing protein [Thermodesulfobacteriota bacterium]|nr:PDZ domain-containing protein [Thermodesulfobacteriota bacterium]